MLLILPIGAVIIVWMAFLRRGEIVAGKAKKRSWISYLIVLILVLALIALRASHPNWLIGEPWTGPSSLLKTLSGRKVDGKTAAAATAVPVGPRPSLSAVSRLG